MRKILVLPFLLFVFSGCMGIFPHLEEVKSNAKMFAEEDAYILIALRAEQVQEYNASSSIFNTLYEKSNKKEYLYRSLENSLEAAEYEKVISRVDALQGTSYDDFVLVRLKIAALLQLQKTNEAKVLAITLVNKSNDVNDYMLVSDIYIQQKKFDTAMKYLESAYAKNYSEKVLDKMSIVLYVNLERKKDAIAQLETHTRVHGCSGLICSRLIGFYSNENNIDGLLSVYLRLYAMDFSDEISSKIVQIYGYKKEYVKLIGFLESTQSNDVLLLQLYMNSKNYAKAFPLAEKLYMKTGEIVYLGQNAICEYESSANKKDKPMLERVIKKLKNVVLIDKSPLYLNYLGYLMIDHEVDVKNGMTYIKSALRIDPNSAFYLDSLAWGYYKLGACEKALTIMYKALKLEGAYDPEVLLHLKAIQNCVQKQKTKEQINKGEEDNDFR